MRTSKPIAGISYNSEKFLEDFVNRFKKAGVFEFCCWIWHEPEEDEKKGHWHFFAIPARILQTVDIEEESKESDPLNPGKPLKILGLRCSNFSDWFQYTLHDPAYMIEKGLTKVYCYSINDYHYTDEDTFQYYVGQVGEKRAGKLENRIIDMVEAGLDYPTIIRSGFVPMRYITSAKEIYKALTLKNDRKDL